MLPRGFFSYLTKLEVLDMYDMWYEYHPYGFGSQALPGGIFEGLTNVRELNLGYNALGAAPIDDGLFDGLSGLEELELRDNPLLKTLPRCVHDLPAGVVVRTDPGVIWPSRTGNRPPTGAPTITGTPRVGETLQVSTSGIADPDGINDAVFSYQWIRTNGDEDAEIDGAETASYTLDGADEGKRVKVRVTFTDDGSSTETLTSAPTTTVEQAATEALSASFPASRFASRTHSGSDDTPQAIIGFSEPVDYTTGDATAAAGDDYTATSGTLTFESGDTERSIEVTLNDDEQVEDDETLTLTLSNPSGAEIGQATATGTITDNDQATTEAALTGAFRNVPAQHDGSTTFSFNIDFSEAVGISYRVLRDQTFTLTNGTITAARRVDGRNDRWEINAEPSGRYQMEITLPGNRACTTTGAVCTAGDDPRPLTNSPTATVAGPPSEPLTATIDNVPTEHDGESVFTFDLTFSENVAAGYQRIRDDAFAISGGTITRAPRRTQGSNREWTLHVRPDGSESVTFTLPATTDCSASGAICTADQRKLSHATTGTVAGPIGISVADTEVIEAAGAVLAFTVTLSRTVDASLSVDYATADGSAAAGADYSSASGRLTIAAGTDEGIIEVDVLDDAHNEGNETLTMTLSNPLAGRLIDGTATGTITNHDAMPKALLARFGRASAGQVVDQIEERMSAGRSAGIDARIGGRRIDRRTGPSLAAQLARRFGGNSGSSGPAGKDRAPGTHQPATPTTPAGWFAQERMPPPNGGRAGVRPPEWGRRNLFSESSLTVNQATESGGTWSLWSRSAQTHFRGRDETLAMTGDVTTSMVGADYARGRTMAGVSVGRTEGAGSYSDTANGRVESTMTGLYPWIGYQLTDRVSVWTVAGYGGGRMTLTPERGGAIDAGMSMRMTAAGMRGRLVGEGRGFEIDVKSDALWVGIASQEASGTGGRLMATNAEVGRIRTAIEGSHQTRVRKRVSVRPSVEIGVRADRGDAEEGAGVDMGLGIAVADPQSGLAIDWSMRTLIVHESEGFVERGMAIAITYDPSPTTPTGLRARVAPGWGDQPWGGAGSCGTRARCRRCCGGPSPENEHWTPRSATAWESPTA